MSYSLTRDKTRMRFRDVGMLALQVLVGTPLIAQAPRIPGLAYQFDVRPSVDQPDRLGLDFNVNYESKRGTADDPRGLHYALRLLAKGFQTFADVPDVNSMTGEVSLVGHWYRQQGAAEPLPPELQMRYLQLADLGPEKLSGKEIDELVRLQNRILGKRYLFSFDAHYRYETNHDVTEDDHALGGGVSGEVPGLNQMLDVIPALTRPNLSTSDARSASQPVRFYLGVDRVTGVDETTIGTLTDKSGLWRGRFELAWGTRVMEGFVLRSSLEAHYFFDSTPALKDGDRRFDSFFQAWLLYPLSQKTSLLVKYIDGRLPPDYDAAKSGKVGLTIALH